MAALTPAGRKNILLMILILSFIGLVTSLYLVQNHYAPATSASFCDLSATVSCSIVNTSTFSVFLNVPVALFGALWFVLLIALSWKARRHDGSFVTGLLVWNIIGILSVVYLVIAEILLQALCPLCTVVHVAIVATLLFSIILFRAEKRVSWKKATRDLKSWVALIVILTLLPLLLFNIGIEKQENYDPLAKCITAKGINMYGSFRCAVCAKTRSMFGPSFQQINEIECHPQGKNHQTELCLQKEIKGTPTWVMEPAGVEVKRFQGFMSIKELREFSGCIE